MDKKQEEEDQMSKNLMFFSYPKVRIDDLVNEEIPPIENYYHLYSQLTKVNIFSTSWIMKYGVPSTYTFSCKYRER